MSIDVELDAARAWSPLIARYFAQFDRVTPHEVDRAAQWAANSSMFKATASWRLKVIAGAPWLHLIRVHSHWAERTNVLRLILLALERVSSLPDFELVYVHNDVDPAPRPSLPLFTNARHTEKVGGLPLPDFTWLSWRETPPWCQVAASLSTEALRHPWHSRDERAFFSGGLDNGRDRKALRQLYHSSSAAREALLVRDVEAGKWFRWGQWDTSNRSGALPAKLPALPPQAACRHKFALSLPGFGYSSRLRALLACGALVVHLQHDDNEFFMPALQDGEHLVVLRGRDAIKRKLLPTLERLRQDPKSAERIADAGRRFAQRWLRHDAIVQYVSSLLAAYASRFRGAVTLPPGYVQLRVGNAEAAGKQLQDATGLCRCFRRRPDGSNATYSDWWRLRWAGEVCMAQGAGQRCRPWAPPGGGRCFAPKCCHGFDCGSRALGCPGGHSVQS